MVICDIIKSKTIQRRITMKKQLNLKSAFINIITLAVFTMINGFLAVTFNNTSFWAIFFIANVVIVGYISYVGVKMLIEIDSYTN